MTFRLILLSPPPRPGKREPRFPPEPSRDAGPLTVGPALADALRRVDAGWSAPGLRFTDVAPARLPHATPVTALAEVDLGRWAGRLLSDVVAEEPAAVAAWTADPAACPHGGESLAAVVARVGDWLDTLHGHRGTGAAIVTPLVLRACVLHGLGAGPQVLRHLDLEPGTWADLRSDGRRWAIRAAGVPIEA